MNITNLTVRVSDGHKPADFAPVRTYDLTAFLENPQGPELQEAIDYLATAGDRFLGRTGTPKVDVVKEKPGVDAEAQPKDKAATKSRKPAAKDPMDLGDPGEGAETRPIEAPSGGATAEATTSSDPMSFDDAGPDFNAPVQPEPSDEVTDEDLNDAAQAANGRTNNHVAIRALIASYNPDKTKQFQLRQIPADKRAEFVAKLKDEKIVPKLDKPA